MGPEAVVLDNASPVGVDHLRTLFVRPDAVLPMVFVGKTAAWPSEDGDPYLFQRLGHIVPDAVSIRYRRILSDPYAAVDASAEMLGKMPVDVLVDGAGRDVGVDE